MINDITYHASDIAEYIKRQFGDESGVQITDNDIYRWLNAAQLEITDRLRPNKAVGTTNVVAGQQTYDLSGLDIFQIESIHYDGKLMLGLSFAEAERKMMDTNPTTQETGAPYIWYEFANQIYLFPVPSTSLTGGLRVYYTKMPTKITGAGDLLSVPDKYFEALVSWILSKAYELNEEFEQSTNQRNIFNNKVMDQIGDTQQTASAVYDVITYLED